MFFRFFVIFLSELAVIWTLPALVEISEQATPADSQSGIVVCRPDTAPTVIGNCVAVNDIAICAKLEISTSRDCSKNGPVNSLCCYSVVLEPSSTITSLQTTPSSERISSPSSSSQSTTERTATSIKRSEVNDVPLNRSMLAQNIMMQQCGVPNGDPTLFSSLQGPSGTRNEVNRHTKLRHVFRGPNRNNLRRFTIQQTIVGGFDAPNGSGSLCWQVATIRTSNFLSFCGGTIVGSRTVLTAAHCLIETTVADYNSSANLITVQTGTITRNIDGGPPWYPNVVPGCAQSINVAKSIPHPKYDPVTMDNDVAVLILAEDIDFRNQSACACKACLSKHAPSVGEVCLVSGFGDEVDMEFGNATASRPAIPLKYVQQPILPPSYNICGVNVGDNGQVTNLDLFLCCGGTVGSDSCQGDSGGPLVCYNQTTKTQFLAGIVSSGIGCGTGLGALYTKVAVYIDWIFSVAPLGDISIMLD